MARLIPSKFEIHRESTKNLKWANYANENILLATHPYSRKAVDLTDKIMQYTAAAMPSLSNASPTFWDSLFREGRVRTIDADEVEWSLRGDGKIETLAKENLHPGVLHPGHNFTEFQIKLDDERFVPGEIIAPKISKGTPVIVKYLPVKDGVDFIYTVNLDTSDREAYFEPELLNPGLAWCKLGFAGSEASRQYGGTSFTSNMSYIRFKTHLSDWGKAVEVTNKAHQLNLKAVAVDDRGKPMEGYPDQIISWLEANMMAEGKAEKNAMIWYGRSLGKNIIDDSSGYHRRLGPGVEEFMEDANLLTYRTGSFDVDIIRDWLQEIGWDKISPQNSNIRIKTGRMGMTQAHDSIREKYTKLNVQVPWEKFITSGPSYPGSNSPGYKLTEPSFLSIDLFPYGSITFEHLPLLDNREFNGDLVHPNTGLPLSSYYYYIMDYGLGEAGNVELLKQKDSEVYAYTCGTWSPAGPINGRSNRAGFTSSHPGRYYTLQMADSFGVRIKDVNLCALIMPDIVY